MRSINRYPGFQKVHKHVKILTKIKKNVIDLKTNILVIKMKHG